MINTLSPKGKGFWHAGVIPVAAWGPRDPTRGGNSWELAHGTGKAACVFGMGIQRGEHNEGKAY